MMMLFLLVSFCVNLALVNGFYKHELGYAPGNGYRLSSLDKMEHRSHHAHHGYHSVVHYPSHAMHHQPVHQHAPALDMFGAHPSFYRFPSYSHDAFQGFPVDDAGYLFADRPKPKKEEQSEISVGQHAGNGQTHVPITEQEQESSMGDTQEHRQSSEVWPAEGTQEMAEQTPKEAAQPEEHHVVTNGQPAYAEGSSAQEVSGEGGHVMGEGGHVMGEGGHVMGEGGHVMGEGGHVMGEGGHVMGEGGHVMGEGGHVMGEEGHVMGEEGHVMGEEGHMVGEDGHMMDPQGNEIVEEGGGIKQLPASEEIVEFHGPGGASELGTMSGIEGDVAKMEGTLSAMEANGEIAAPEPNTFEGETHPNGPSDRGEHKSEKAGRFSPLAFGLGGSPYGDDFANFGHVMHGAPQSSSSHHRMPSHMAGHYSPTHHGPVHHGPHVTAAPVTAHPATPQGGYVYRGRRYKLLFHNGRLSILSDGSDHAQHTGHPMHTWFRK